MSWWIWIIIAVIAFLVFSNSISSKGESNRRNSRNTQPSRSESTVEEIVAQITTISNFRNLEKKLDRADEKRQEAFTSELAEERAERNYQTLQEAYDIARDEILRWQYIPSFDIDTPLSTLQKAYKVYSLDEYEQAFAESGSNTEEWFGIEADNDPDDKDSELLFLIKFRKIVEDSELAYADKIKKLNSFASRNKEDASLYFDTESPLKVGEQWFVNILENDGLPLASELYQEGYTSHAKCLNIDVKEFSARKGVGPKKIDQLKTFQGKYSAEPTSEHT